MITRVKSHGIGNIAVSINLPKKPRYPEGAPVVVRPQGFFTPITSFVAGGREPLDSTRIGAIFVQYMWPGLVDVESGERSEGKYDHGGPVCLEAFRDVLRFACGEIPDVDGKTIDRLLPVKPLTENVGMYAHSHSGIIATNVMAHHGKDLPGVRYLVGRENPTVDAMYALEMGYYDDDEDVDSRNRKPVYNPCYHPDGYTLKSVDIDYSTVGWLKDATHPNGVPRFVVDGGTDYIIPDVGRFQQHPVMWGKSYYSAALTRALLENGALTRESWLYKMATPEETERDWQYRTTVDTYPLLTTSAPNLKVMLVFAKNDHAMINLDKPQIRHAYDGFKKAAGLWVRLNPDLCYAESEIGISGDDEFPDNPANTEPRDWMQSKEWGHLGRFFAYPLAALAEMADRVREDNWEDNLDEVLYGPAG